MLAYLLRRLVLAGLTLWLSATLVFGALLFIPGDPVQTILGLEARAALLFRMARGSLLEVLSQDYIRTARAKGVPEARVLFKHALRPASLPLVTALGLEGGFLLTGAVVVEAVFALPGLGSLALTALEARDYPLLQGLVLLLAALIVLFNLWVDLLYGVLDPRVEYA